jgi:hypothetical protein
MFKIGDKIWTYHLTMPGVIGPLTVRSIDERTRMCVCSNKETTVRISPVSMASTRRDAACLAKRIYQNKIRGMQLASESLEERLENFIKKEGV